MPDFTEDTVKDAVTAHMDYWNAGRRKVAAIRAMKSPEGEYDTPEYREFNRRIKRLREAGEDV